jgi:hypothetical protein
MVRALIALARERRIGTVYALTHAARFFQQLGFTLANRADWPEKVHGDCMWCSRKERCQLTAVVFLIERATQPGLRNASGFRRCSGRVRHTATTGQSKCVAASNRGQRT